MILQEFLAPPVLADTVSSITVLQVERLPGEWSIPLVAKAAPSIVYQSTGDGAQLVLYGQNVAPITVRATGSVTMIAWFLRPHRLGPLFGMRAGEITDCCVPLDDLALVRELALVERLGIAGGTSERLRLMEEFVVGLCALARDGNRVAGYAAGVIAAGEGRMPLQSLQEELRVTERSLQRLFAEHVGVSPKMFSRICQFQPAFRQLSTGDFSRLSDIAYDNGYADQSHLIRVFREFTGFTPGEYLERTRAFLEGVKGAG
jgi:AraC-like DNA-binding protein